MPTVNNSSEKNNSSGLSGGAGVLIGAALVIIVLIVIIVYSLPYIKQQVNSMTHPGTPIIKPTINVQLPAQEIPSSSTTTTK